MHKNIATTEQINAALAGGKNTICAIGVSGGKDSGCLALEINEYLDSIGFAGERILIHSDLGLIEHAQSIEICRKLSEKVNQPLVVVKPLRPMLERWEYKWERVCSRFANLETVRISTGFSSAVSRFCTSEEKVAPISQYLKKTYPGKTIINCVGIRRDESTKRASKPISEDNDTLTVKTHGTFGITWHPIVDFLIEDVYLSHKRHCFCLHEVYSWLGMTRVSCSFCILAGDKDLRASLGDKRNHPAFRRIAQLEILSTFSFKPDFWLADLAPHLLTESERESLAESKERATRRRIAEKNIPKELLFNKNTGFPAFQPTIEQATALGAVRQQLGEILNLQVGYTTGRDVCDRYAELLEKKHAKEAEKQRKADRRAAKTNINEPIQVKEQTNLFAGN